MIRYLFVCNSLTHAQRVNKSLARNGISSFVQKVPQKLSWEGCQYGVKISEKNLSAALVTLNKAALSPIKVYVENELGNFQQVNS